MKFSRIVVIAAFFSCAAYVQTAAAGIDNDAAIVQLRQSCVEDGQNLSNCFTDMPTLNTWVWGTRQPDQINPLLIEMGPGTFNGQFTCVNGGHVSLRGSGQGLTVLESGSMPISADGCTEMKFADFTVRNTQTLLGIGWLNGGTSVWENMHLDMLGYAWFEGAGTGCQWEPGEHYWLNSRITSRSVSGGSTTAYYATCDVSWFIGSEVTAIADSSYTGFMSVQTVRVPGGEVHLYGSVIRSISEAGTDITKQGAVFARDGGRVHIHGTGIDVISADDNNIIALEAVSESSIHANQASYVMKTGAGGTKTRVLANGGTIRAPYMWEEGVTPPDIISADGSDMVVKTGNADNKPHLLLYSTDCASGWFDVVTNACN